jgi:choline transport protein
MNYLAPVVVIIVVLILVVWYGGKKKTFFGPVSMQYKCCSSLLIWFQSGVIAEILVQESSVAIVTKRVFA